jgi:two-component system response regulator ChvI
MAQISTKIPAMSRRPGAEGSVRHDELASVPPARVVIIDPSESYRTSLAAYLRAQRFVITEFDDPAAAIDYIMSDAHVDAVLVASDMPQVSGINLLAQIQGLGLGIPVALIAAARDQVHEEAALEYGAADFFSKARSPSILAKRLRLLVSGVKTPGAAERRSADMVAVGQLGLKLKSFRAVWAGDRVPLTVTEFKIVRLLACRAGEKVSYREIYDVVHGSGFVAGDGPDGYRSNVRSLIRNIRNRFRGIDAEFAEIENLPGYGYRWRISGEATMRNDSGGEPDAEDDVQPEPEQERGESGYGSLPN